MSGIMLMLVGGKSGGVPVNTVAPALSDSTPIYNQTISTTTGTWTSTGAITYSYQWQLSGVDISGATSSSYTVTGDDIFFQLRCVVTATNSFGSAAAATNYSSIVVLGSAFGYTSGGTITIDKFPFASDANATDVGDLTVARQNPAGQQH